jgi:hypothetical protein
VTVREAYKTLGLDPTSATPEDARTRFRAAGRDGGLDDPFGWIDDLFREFARGNAMSVMWPAVGMLVSFDVWMAGWGFGATPRKRVG